jgi:hypothetical protein
MLGNVVGRPSGEKARTARSGEEHQSALPLHPTEVNGPDIKAVNNFDSAPVKPAQRSAMAEGKMLHCSLPPHSYTMFRAQVV